MSKTVAPISSSVLLPHDDPEDATLDDLPSSCRDLVMKRRVLVRRVNAIMEDDNVRRGTAILSVLAEIQCEMADPALVEAARDLGHGGNMVSTKTLYRWCVLFEKHGNKGLYPGYKGRARKTQGWEARAMHLFARPQKPSISTVTLWLQDEGFESATYPRVRRYLQSLPTNKTTSSPKRVGAHYHRQNLGPYVVRDHSTTPVGFCYQGDGHTCDVYVQHPATGNHFRPELTAWIDVRTNYLVGWWLSEAESAVSTLYALSHAIMTHDHVPAAIHTDPGSGFNNRMMDDQVTGFLSRLDIDVIRAIPGNAKGKGLIERWFGIFEERCGKQFATYCGHCRTDDLLSRLETKVRRGEIAVPTLAQYMSAIGTFVERYNNTPQAGLDNRTPASLWCELDRVGVEMPGAAIVRPQERRTVRREGVTLFKMLYRDPVLAGYAGKQVIVEYDLHDGSSVTIRDERGRLICDAALVEAVPGMPASRIEQLQAKRLQGQLERKERQIAEMSQRAQLTHSHTDELVESLQRADGNALDNLDPETLLDPEFSPSESDAIDLDITRTDYE